MKIEKSKYTQAGYKCDSCSVHFKIYNGLKAPENCPNCGVPGSLHMEWNQEVELTVSSVQLPLVP